MNLESVGAQFSFHSGRGAKPTPMDFGMFEVTVDASQAIAYMNTLKDAFNSSEILDEIGQQGVSIVKDLLEPLRRSGRTQDSWKYKINGQSVVIYSDNNAATYLATGFSKAPSTNVLREWMNYKSEFSGLTEKEANRIAFAIRKSILNNSAPGPNSDIAKLQPVGERKFDYIKLATDQITEMVKTKLLNYSFSIN